MSLEWMPPIVNLPSWTAENNGAAPAVAGAKAGAGAEKACRDFEAYFTASMFSEMTKTLELGQKDGISGQEEDWMWSLTGQTVAQELAKGEGLGLKKELMQSLSQQPGLTRNGLD
jgi:Rod binding domain-containing protein